MMPVISDVRRAWHDTIPYLTYHVLAAARCRRRGDCRAVRPATVEVTAIIPAPDDHFTLSPNCAVTAARIRRIGEARKSPTVCARIVSSSAVQRDAVKPAPDNHFTPSPNDGVLVVGIRRDVVARTIPA